MIKKLKKGNKAPYKGYLLGVHEYEDYMMLKELVPSLIEGLGELKKS